ncbi:RHS repeat-associated core domain-containing protein [Achromobacter sp. NFACC18-2]|nr:RHS repeat-associated core domain-containing protein [Achromobacter sp. NFACC18-2]
MLPHQQPVYADAYDIDRDPLWTTSPDPDPVDAMAWYHCDHLGPPQELTDAQGEIAWSAHYLAWGAAKEAISDAARAERIRNPIRFQGQHLDPETGLHYNRHRYYDPQTGRLIAKDTIRFAGGSIFTNRPMAVQCCEPHRRFKLMPSSPSTRHEPPPQPALNSLFQNSRISAFFSVSPFRSYACSNLTSASVNPTRFNASGSDALVTVGA